MIAMYAHFTKNSYIVLSLSLETTHLKLMDGSIMINIMLSIRTYKTWVDVPIIHLKPDLYKPTHIEFI